MNTAVKLIARMTSPVGSAPALDALLIAVAARDAGIPPPIGAVAPGDVPVPPPLVMERGLYCASVGMVDAVGHQMRWTQRPAPLRRHLALDEGRRKLKLTTGAGKPTRSPMRTAIAPTVTWYALATDPDELLRLLRQHVTHIGPRRAAGYGNVGEWQMSTVESWQGFPMVDHDGAPLRPLPMDWPGVDHAAGRAARGRVIPPYWCGPTVDCIVPTWMVA